MTKEFIGRNKELDSIKAFLNKTGCYSLLVYGRRRVGKSELIKEAIKNRKECVIYYEAKQTTEKNNLDSLNELVSEKFKEQKGLYESLEELIDYIFKKSIDKKIILVIDEYSYLSQIVKGFDSILKSIIEKYKKNSNLKLIISGSYVDMMRDLLDHHNPLYGRFELIINLKQMDYYDSSLFYKNFSNEDKVKIYSVFGGVPYYNQLIDDSLSVKENIINLIASKDARLENEILMYLKSEIQKINNANEVFQVLANGASKFTDILSKSNIKSGPTLIDTLDKLIGMELVEKRAPINAENNRKKIGYYIIDNLSSFYYRYIYRYNSELNVMPASKFYEKNITDSFEKQYVPKKFEEICKQYLIRENLSNKILEPFYKIGKYYYDLPKENKNGEFDIVTEGEKGYIFYEVKFKKDKMKKSEMLKEIEQVKTCGLDCYKYGFISSNGFVSKDNNKNIYYTLKDIYKK